MLIGASNLWFPVTQSVVVMPVTTPAEHHRDLATLVRITLGLNLVKFRGKHRCAESTQPAMRGRRPRPFRQLFLEASASANMSTTSYTL